MEFENSLKTRLLFHHESEESAYIKEQMKHLHGGEHCIIVSTDPRPLRLGPKTENMVEQNHGYHVVTNLYMYTVIDSSEIRSSNELFVKIKTAIEKGNDNSGRGIELVIDLTTANKLEAFTCSKISSLYPATLVDDSTDVRFDPMPSYVELNDREQNLLIFYYDRKELFSKKDVLEDIDDYNANKYQMSKEKFEKTGLIKLMLPPVDREYSVGKNPDYFMVTFSGYYNALINKRCTALQEEIFSKGPMRYREERYMHLYNKEPPCTEHGEIDLDKSIENTYNDFRN